MKFIRLSDQAPTDMIRVKDMLALPDLADAGEPFSALVASGAIAANGADAVRVTRGDAVFSAGLGDHIAVIAGEAYALSERELLRGFDPAP